MLCWNQTHYICSFLSASRSQCRNLCGCSLQWRWGRVLDVCGWMEKGGVTDMALGECTSVWDGRCCVSVCCALICALGLMRYRCRSVRFNTGEGEMEKDGERRERWRWTKGRELASVRGREVEAEWKHIQSRLYKKSTQRTAGSNIHIYRYNRLAGLVRRRLDYLKCVIQSLVQRLLKTHCLYP